MYCENARTFPGGPKWIWPKATLPKKVNRFNSQQCNNPMVYRGVTSVSALVKAGLVDEYPFFVNPVAMGSGLVIFKSRVNLTLANVMPYNNSVL